MFKLFAKKENKVRYEAVVVEISTGLKETIVTDADGIKTLAMNGYDVIETKEI